MDRPRAGVGARPTETAETLLSLNLHAGSVRNVAFSKQGHLLLSCSADLSARVWDVSGVCVLVLTGHTDWISCGVFSPGQSDVIATCAYDQTVRLWETQSGKSLHVLRGHKGFVFTVEFSPTTRLLASGGEDSTIRLWDPPTGQCLRTISNASGWIACVAFSVDGALVAGASAGDLQLEAQRQAGQHTPSQMLGTTRVWDTDTGSFVREFGGHQGWVKTVVYSDRHIAISGWDMYARLWWLWENTNVVVREWNVQTVVESMAFSRDGVFLAVGGMDGRVRILCVQTGDCIKTIKAHVDKIRCVAFSPCGRIVASGGDDKRVHISLLQTSVRARGSDLTATPSPFISASHVRKQMQNERVRLADKNRERLMRAQQEMLAQAAAALSAEQAAASAARAEEQAALKKMREMKSGRNRSVTLGSRSALERALAVGSKEREKKRLAEKEAEKDDVDTEAVGAGATTSADDSKDKRMVGFAAGGEVTGITHGNGLAPQGQTKKIDPNNDPRMPASDSWGGAMFHFVCQSLRTMELNTEFYPKVGEDDECLCDDDQPHGLDLSHLSTKAPSHFGRNEPSVSASNTLQPARKQTADSSAWL